MLAIAMREHGCDGHGGGGVIGEEAAGMKGIVRAVEEAAGVRTGAEIADRLAATGDGFEREIDKEGVGHGFGGQERGVLCVGIFVKEAKAIKQSGRRGDHGGGVQAAKGIVETVEVGGVAKRRRAVRVGGDEDGGCNDNANGGPDVFGVDQRNGKKPDGFLVGKYVGGQFFQGDAAVL